MGSAWMWHPTLHVPAAVCRHVCQFFVNFYPPGAWKWCNRNVAQTATVRGRSNTKASSRRYVHKGLSVDNQLINHQWLEGRRVGRAVTRWLTQIWAYCVGKEKLHIHLTDGCVRLVTIFAIYPTEPFKWCQYTNKILKDSVINVEHLCMFTGHVKSLLGPTTLPSMSWGRTAEKTSELYI